jgi:hypothetical protein
MEEVIGEALGDSLKGKKIRFISNQRRFGFLSKKEKGRKEGMR